MNDLKDIQTIQGRWGKILEMVINLAGLSSVFKDHFRQHRDHYIFALFSRPF